MRIEHRPAIHSVFNSTYTTKVAMLLMQDIKLTIIAQARSEPWSLDG